MRRFWIWAALVLAGISSLPAEAATYRAGMSGDGVLALQRELSEKGYLAREADGEYGSTTAKAVAFFQRDHGMTATGVADEATQEKLRASEGKRKGGGVLLAQGNLGDGVEACQRALVSAGFLKGKTDGAYGPATVAAVSAFQKVKKLPVSGAIDEETYAALMKGKPAKKPAAKKEKPQKAEKGAKKETKPEPGVKRAEKPDTKAASEHLRGIQKKLTAAGYDAGEADGVWGSRTAGALSAFQRDHGLSVTGQPDQETETLLMGGSTKKAEPPKSLKRGDRGGRVARLQNLLTLHGFSDGSTDGVFGGGTESQLKHFQAYAGLTEDGVAGDSVWGALEKPPVFRGEYKEIFHMDSTAYTPYDSGGTGHTALGNMAGKGHAAVDPDVIPLGSILFIEDYGYAVADDIGGSINGNVVDVGVDTLDQAYRWGSRKVTVYLVK